MTRTFFLRFFLLAGAACLLAGSALSTPAACEAKLKFRRVFKGSSPKFIEINVREDSDLASYEIRQLDEEAGASTWKGEAQASSSSWRISYEARRWKSK